eukprot:Skav224483  [mRNA]  locus=scaffold1302:842211:843020:- [translate_table: standard]
MKASAYSVCKMTDKTLGINNFQLTRAKNNSALTKPHIFQQRLCLMKTLVAKYHSKKSSGMELDIRSEMSKMWVNQLAMPNFFLTWKDRAEDPFQFLIIGKSPWMTLCYKLEKRGNSWGFSKDHFGAKRFQELCLQDFDSILMAASETCLEDPGDFVSVAWKRTTEWMPMTEFVCEYWILTIPAKLLSSICRHLKIKGYSQLCHRERCRKFLEHCGYDSDRIDEILILLPEKPPRKRKSNDDEDRCCVHSFLAFHLSYGIVYQAMSNDSK